MAQQKTVALDYKLLFRALPGRYLVFLPDDPDFTFVEVSDLQLSTTGQYRDDVIGKPFFDVFLHVTSDVLGDGAEELKEAIRRVIKTKHAETLKTFRYDIAEADGTITEHFWQPTYYPILDEQSNVQYVAQKALDVTEQKRAEIALHKQTQQATVMSDSLPIMLFTADTKGNITYFNKEWLRYTGLDFKYGRDSKWMDVIHENDRAEAATRWNHAMHTGEPLQIELRMRRHDGSYRWHLCRANPIRDDNGEITVWFGSNTDIDEWRRASSRKERLEHITKALKEQRKELVALNRTKDEFISVASHQLRTPATAVKQYLGMMLEGYVGRLTIAQREAMQTAYDSNERQLETVNDLLHVAQADSGKLVLNKEKTDVIKLLQDIVDEQQGKFKQKKQALVFEYSKRKAIATIDKARIRMVFENLIDNAHKYTYEGKSIHVACASTPNCVTVRVQDQGVGIDPDQLPKLFQKFSRIENPLSTLAGGTGLGLYWAQKIVALHDGTLEVESKIGEGTTFIVSMPK